MRTLIRKSVAPLAVALGALACNGLLAYRAIQSFLAESDVRRREFEAVGVLRRVESLCREAESGQRGFLLTGDEAYLEPYHSAAASLPAALSALAPVEPWTARDLAAFRADARAKLRELSRTVAAERAGRHADALGVVRRGSGRALMAAVRDRADAMADAAASVQRVRTARIDRAGRLALLAFPLAGVAVPSVVALSLYAAVSEFRARVRAEARADAAVEHSRINSELLNSLSHDLRTPLNAVAQNLFLAEELLRRRDCDGAADALHGTHGSVMATAEILDQFLEAARADRGAVCVETFGLAGLLDEVASVVLPGANLKGLALHHRCDPTRDIAVTTDRKKLKRVLLNLASNAVKFTDRGSVVMECRRVRGGVTVSVSDTGCGIDPELLPRLFTDFTQGRNPERDPRKGYGLGLSIARRLCGAIGARIHVTSTPGVGTTFRVELPDAAAGR